MPPSYDTDDPDFAPPISKKHKKLENASFKFNQKKSRLFQCPNEVLEIIFASMDIDCMKNLMLVCKRFYEILTTSKALVHKFQMVLSCVQDETMMDLSACNAIMNSNRIFESINIGKLSRFTEIIHVEMLIQRIGPHVKYAAFHKIRKIEKTCFEKIFKHLPNLESVKMVDVNLLDTQDEDEDNSSFYEAPVFAHLKHLEIKDCSKAAQDIFLNHTELISLDTNVKCVEILKKQTKLEILNVQLVDMTGVDEDLFEEDPKDFNFQLKQFNYESMLASTQNLSKFLGAQKQIEKLELICDFDSSDLDTLLINTNSKLKKLSLNLQQEEGPIDVKVLKKKYPGVEELSLGIVWDACGPNAWTLEEVEKFIQKFPEIKKLKLELNSLKQGLKVLTFKEFKKLEFVEMQLYNDGTMLPFLDIPKLKRLEFLNARSTKEDFQAFLGKHQILESILFDASLDSDLLELAILGCPKLKNIQAYGLPITEKLRLITMYPEKLEIVHFPETFNPNA